MSPEVAVPERSPSKRGVAPVAPVYTAQRDPTAGALYFVDGSETGDIENRDNILALQCVPNEMRGATKPAYASYNSVGTSVPTKQFTGSLKTLHMELDYYADESEKEDVIRKARWLERFVVSNPRGARTLQFVFGEWYPTDFRWALVAYDWRMSLFHQNNSPEFVDGTSVTNSRTETAFDSSGRLVRADTQSRNLSFVPCQAYLNLTLELVEPRTFSSEHPYFDTFAGNTR